MGVQSTPRDWRFRPQPQRYVPVRAEEDSLEAEQLSTPDFIDYAVYDYWPRQWLDLSGREARSEYRRFIGAVPSRMTMFEALLRRNALPGGCEPAKLQALNDWFLEHVTADASGVWPAPEWRSFAMDVGLYLGQGVIAAHPHLHWDLAATGPTFVEYRQHVIVGFTQKGYDRHRISPSGQMFTYAKRAVDRDGSEIVIIDGEPIQVDSGPVKTQRFVDFYNRLDRIA
jgi:hypothetical protein